MMLAAVMVFSLCSPAWATEDLPDLSTYEKQVAYLLANGFYSHEIESIPDVEYLAKLLASNPDEVIIKNSELYYDQASAIIEYAKMSDEQKEKGFSDAEMQLLDGKINYLAASNPSNLANSLGIDEMEAYQLIAAANGERIIRPRQISESTLAFSMKYYAGVCGHSNHPVSYSVLLSFQWKGSGPFFLLDDDVSCTWGGALAVYTPATVGHVDYFDGTRKTPSTVIAPGIGISFRFPVSSSIFSTATTGSFAFEIYQTQRMDHNAIIVSAYAHRTMTVFGAGFSFGTNLSPSLSLNYGWRSSKQEQGSITY